jgi:coenzyme F420 hydrogenase subunit beta
MVFGERFNYPELESSKCISCGQCLDVCPGKSLIEEGGRVPSGCTCDDCRLVQSTDEQIRNSGASGGFVTGLFRHLLESKFVAGCVVCKPSDANPFLAEGFIATDTDSLLPSIGSNYSPVSGCLPISDILGREGRFAVMGTPCMIEGITRLENRFPKLKQKIALKVGLVCSGMPSRLATRNYLAACGLPDAGPIRKISYRGTGWPGRFRVVGKDGNLLLDIPYLEGASRGIIGVDTYLRCKTCLDHWSGFADIVVSDPWSKDMIRTEKIGKSAIMIRTDRGRSAVDEAIAAGKLASSAIPRDEMGSFNRHLSIHDAHARYSWLFFYNLIFLHRVKYFRKFLAAVGARNFAGLKTTATIFSQERYYY